MTDPRPAVADSVKPLTREELEARFADIGPLYGSRSGPIRETDPILTWEDFDRLLATARAGMEDAERFDWLAKVMHMDAECAPTIRGTKTGWVVWDQYNGLTMMGKGETIRAAIDAARRNTGGGR